MLIRLDEAAEIRRVLARLATAVQARGAVVKHLPGEHDQSLHGKWATASGQAEVQFDAFALGALLYRLRGLGSQAELRVREDVVRRDDGWALQWPLLDFETALDHRLGRMGPYNSGPDVDRYHDAWTARYKAATFRLKNYRAHLAELRAKTPEALAAPVGQVLTEVLNDPDLSGLLHESLVYHQTINVGRSAPAYADPALQAALEAVGRKDDQGRYDLDKLDARFGPFTEANWHQQRLALWERQGEIRTGLDAWVSDMADWQKMRDAFMADDDLLTAAWQDMDHFNQWAMRHHYGDQPLTVYRGVYAGQAEMVERGQGLERMTAWTSALDVARSHAASKKGGRVLATSIAPWQVLACWLSSEAMYMAGEEEFLLYSEVPAAAIHLEPHLESEP